MAKKTEILLASEEYLKAIPLPQHEKSYTVISHKFIIETIDQELEKKGLVVTKKQYTSTDDGDIARGILHIEYGNDPDMTMILTWINSYNKKVKFSCSVGGFIVDNQTAFIGKEGTGWVRKHTGTADQEAYNVMKHLVEGSEELFDKVLLEKETMKKMPLSIEDYGCVLGALYFEHEAITVTQSSAIIQEKRKPTNLYNDQDTLWWLYKVIMFGIREMAPGKWQTSQQVLHHLIMNQYAIAVDKNEEVILDTDIQKENISIEEVTEQSPIISMATVDLESSETVYEKDGNGEPLVSAKMVITDFSEKEVAPERVKFAIDESEEPKIHVESDQEYEERIAKIEGEPEKEQSGFAEGLEIDHNLGEKEEVVDLEVEVMSTEEVIERYGDQVEQSEEEVLPTKESFVKYMTENEGISVHLIQYFTEEHYNDTLSMQENIDAFRKWHEPKVAPVKTETQVSEDTGFQLEEPTLKDEFGNNLEEDLNLHSTPIDTALKESFKDELVFGKGFIHISEEGEVKAVNPFSEEVIKAMSGITDDVEILTPEIAAEKHAVAMSEDQIAMIEEEHGIRNEEPFIQPEVEEEEEEEEQEGFEVPESIRAQEKLISERMINLYGELKQYHAKEANNQINVTIDSTGECFYVLQ